MLVKVTFLRLQGDGELLFVSVFLLTLLIL